jgi:hypothetical protein
MQEAEKTVPAFSPPARKNPKKQVQESLKKPALSVNPMDQMSFYRNLSFFEILQGHKWKES